MESEVSLVIGMKRLMMKMRRRRWGDKGVGDEGVGDEDVDDKGDSNKDYGNIDASNKDDGDEEFDEEDVDDKDYGNEDYGDIDYSNKDVRDKDVDDEHDGDKDDDDEDYGDRFGTKRGEKSAVLPTLSPSCLVTDPLKYYGLICKKKTKNYFWDLYLGIHWEKIWLHTKITSWKSCFSKRAD